LPVWNSRGPFTPVGPGKAYPSWNRVTSKLTMSPSSSGLASGIP
jgi:hypothetical protein